MLFPRHNAVEVELDFAGDDAADAFDEAAGLVVFLAEADDLVELHAGRYRVGGLINDLIAGVELGDDEVAGGAVGEHAAGVGVVIRARAGEAGQQAVVQIDDAAAGVFPAAGGRQDAHIAGEDDVIDVVLVEDSDQALVVSSAFGVADHLPRNAELLGEAAAGGAIADHDGRLSTNLA